MAELTFIIQTTDEMKEFIFFLYKSGLSIQMKEDDRFYDLLYKSLKEKKVYPIWLKRENLNRYLTIMNEKYTDLHLVENDYLLSTILMKPKPLFAQACGTENLTKGGLISKKMAYNFIMNQVNHMKMPVVDDIIYINEDLQKLLDINSGKIDKYELILLIDRLFIE